MALGFFITNPGAPTINTATARKITHSSRNLIPVPKQRFLMYLSAFLCLLYRLYPAQSMFKKFSTSLVISDWMPSYLSPCSLPYRNVWKVRVAFFAVHAAIRSSHKYISLPRRLHLGLNTANNIIILNTLFTLITIYY